MKKSELKYVFNLLGLQWDDFQKYMVGKTCSLIENETYYNSGDIRYYFSLKLTKV